MDSSEPPPWRSACAELGIAPNPNPKSVIRCGAVDGRNFLPVRHQPNPNPAAARGSQRPVTAEATSPFLRCGLQLVQRGIRVQDHAHPRSTQRHRTARGESVSGGWGSEGHVVGHMNGNGVDRLLTAGTRRVSAGPFFCVTKLGDAFAKNRRTSSSLVWATAACYARLALTVHAMPTCHA